MIGFFRREAKNWSIHPKKHIQPHHPRPRISTRPSHMKRIANSDVTGDGKIIFPSIKYGTATNGMVIGQMGAPAWLRACRVSKMLPRCTSCSREKAMVKIKPFIPTKATIRSKLILPFRRMKNVIDAPAKTINTVTARRTAEKSPRPTRKNKINPVIAAAVKLITKECLKRPLLHRAPLLSFLFNSST